MSGIEFATRIRETFIELEPGERKVWLLPPFTPGFINVLVNHADLGSTVDPSGSSGSAGAGGGIARARPPFGPAAGDFNLGLDGGGGGGTGPALELEMKLLCGAQEPPATKGPGQLSFDAAGFAASDKWMLQITRRADGSVGSRRYRVHVNYPSILPVETRRIPASFFARGFDANWNANPYLDYISIASDRIAYRWFERYAEIYRKPQGDQYIELPYSDYYTLPKIHMKSISVSVGGEPFPYAPPPVAPWQTPDTPYLKLMIRCAYEGSREVEIENPGPNITFDLPDPEHMWFEVKLFIGASGDRNSPGLAYEPVVSSPLLDMLNYDVDPLLPGSETINIKDEIKRAIEHAIWTAQFSDTGGNMVNDYVRPYIVGHYDLYRLGWDPEQEDVLVSYVGRQVPPAAEAGPTSHHGPVGPTTGGTNTGDGTSTGGGGEPRPRLFNTPDEMPLPPVQPQRTVDVSPGNLSKIEHIVVLMQENRSFDHILGYLSRDGMLQRENPATGEGPEHREPAQAQVDGLLPGDNARDVNRYDNVDYRSTRRTTTAWPSYALPGPFHGAACVTKQVSDGMGDFVKEWARHIPSTYQPGPNEPVDPTGKHPLQLVMDYLTDAELPAYGELTREFAICDRWHCSHLGGTLPNRFISLTGDFSRDIYGAPDVENPELKGFFPLEMPTFFDHLTAAGVPWKLFEHGYSTLRLVRNYTFDEQNIESFRGGFEAAVEAGLPPVTFIEPDYIEAPGGINNDDHAPSDMANGQRLVAEIMKALLAENNQDRWAKTLFIITYDEHGGFYDHVQPPTHVETHNPDGSVTQVPIPPLSVGEPRLGVRVPAFIISPLIPGADANGNINVSHTVFDHTSIAATILRRFCGPKAPFMGARCAAAKDVGELLTLDVARPYSEFNQLRRAMEEIAHWPAAHVSGDTAAMPPPLRKPTTVEDLEENFSGLLAFASSVSGRGR
ncbi:MAG: hypothetical protein JF628_05090 [Sphingomonas sp.]|nr:hypothetical protein [Sphingomonas sp.]